MTTLRKAAQQALEALEGKRYTACGWRSDCDKAITALRAALEEPVQEPNLSRCPNCGGPADNGHDRSIPPNPYFCTKCMAEPVQEPVAWLFTNLQSGDYDFCYQEDEHDHDREMWHKQPLYTTPPQQALTIERLRDALVASRIIPPAAVEDPDEYDDGVTLFRIEALHRRIT